jgi:hypothetical protein
LNKQYFVTKLETLSRDTSCDAYWSKISEEKSRKKDSERRRKIKSISLHFIAFREFFLRSFCLIFVLVSGPVFKRFMCCFSLFHYVILDRREKKNNLQLRSSTSVSVSGSLLSSVELRLNRSSIGSGKKKEKVVSFVCARSN